MSQHWPLGDACGLLQDSVQLQAFAVQQPPEGNVSQLTYDPKRLIQVQEHGEFSLTLPRVDPDCLCHQMGGDPLQPCHFCPGNHKLDWERKRKAKYLSFFRLSACHRASVLWSSKFKEAQTFHDSSASAVQRLWPFFNSQFATEVLPENRLSCSDKPTLNHTLLPNFPFAHLFYLLNFVIYLWIINHQD